MLNQFKTDEFFLSNICLTSVEELFNPQMPNRFKTDEFFCITSV